VSHPAWLPERSLWIYGVPDEIALSAVHPGFRDRYRELLLASADVSLWMAQRGDVVVLHELPEPAYLAYLADVRGFVPEIHLCRGTGATLDELADADADLAGLVASRGLRTLIPFLPTERSDRIARSLRLDSLFASAELVHTFNSKARAYRLFAELGLTLPAGGVCTDEVELGRQLEALRERGVRELVLKPDRASGGAGIVELAADVDDVKLRALAAKVGYPLIAEARLSPRYSGGYQFHIEASGDVRFLGATRQHLHQGFRYKGCDWPLAPDETELHRVAGIELCKALRARGYFGIVGFDSLIGDVVVPAVEINARFTGSTPLLFVGEVMGGDHRWFQGRNFVCPAGADFATVSQLLGRELLDPSGPNALVVLSCAGVRHATYPMPPVMRVLLMTRAPDCMESLAAEVSGRLAGQAA
jgi:Pre ATP-grasp domain/ATP-grasp domain